MIESQDHIEPQAVITVTGDSIAVLTELGNIIEERADFMVKVADSFGVQVLHTSEDLHNRAQALSGLKDHVLSKVRSSDPELSARIQKGGDE
jgi:hypothetical protein